MDLIRDSFVNVDEISVSEDESGIKLVEGVEFGYVHVYIHDMIAYTYTCMMSYSY